MLSPKMVRPNETSLWQLSEKVIFRRLLKNAQMQGTRNPEE
jgi:hypothetical protein